MISGMEPLFVPFALCLWPKSTLLLTDPCFLYDTLFPVIDNVEKASLPVKLKTTFIASLFPEGSV
jgi:hypothetical protein